MAKQPQPFPGPISNFESRSDDALRLLSRSPHPYRRQPGELPHPSEKLGPAILTTSPSLYPTQNTDDEVYGVTHHICLMDARSALSTESDSGTEADDEHILKGLPAPKWRPHKGLRGSDGFASPTPSPLLSPAVLNESERSLGYRPKILGTSKLMNERALSTAEKFRQKRGAEIRRRLVEFTILGIVGLIVLSDDNVRRALQGWRREISCQLIIAASLLILYPLRLLRYLTARKSFERWPRITIPASFDPAPLLYPPILTTFVASILSVSNPNAILLNITLSLSSFPSELIPSVSVNLDGPNTLHWFISCIPLFISKIYFNTSNRASSPIYGVNLSLPRPDWEMFSLIYPLHEALCITLRYLTTTSLLRAELQLLSIGLVNLLLLASSPQAIILQALLWFGGLGILVTCSHVIRWAVSLARVPKWRFRREENLRMRSDLSLSPKSGATFSKLGRITNFLAVGSEVISDADENDTPMKPRRRLSDLKADFQNISDGYTKISLVPNTPQRSSTNSSITSPLEFMTPGSSQRRHTLPSARQPVIRSSKTTPSGRKKRSASSSLRRLFLLTEREATIRKWIYATYVYMCVTVIIFVGIRSYVGKYALSSNEPIGWAMGYLFGNIPWFRMQVVKANLERWIRLPERRLLAESESYHQGWVENLRQATIGPANTRLIISSYWLCIIIIGLTIVSRLSTIYEVDTRRKVFHFMMVAMFLPATYVDPAFSSLALSLALGIFLLLDVFRASQLPPLSKPLALFLTPFVDGRDLRGPVVISHIFLLIGSAIPLWLSLGALPRSGHAPWTNWDLPARDVSMVSGVICVGMGDAAASLIGRRLGRHKWFWGGGKSLEGSIAFAVAVAFALALAKAWLRIGGWPESHNSPSDDGSERWFATAAKATVAAGIASLAEAVLTGGNDNVVVPVVLWLVVKGLGM